MKKCLFILVVAVSVGGWNSAHAQGEIDTNNAYNGNGYPRDGRNLTEHNQNPEIKPTPRTADVSDTDKHKSGVDHVKKGHRKVKKPTMSDDVVR